MINHIVGNSLDRCAFQIQERKRTAKRGARSFLVNRQSSHASCEHARDCHRSHPARTSRFPASLGRHPARDAQRVHRERLASRSRLFATHDTGARTRAITHTRGVRPGPTRSEAPQSPGIDVMRCCFPTTMLLSAGSNIAARRASEAAECTTLCCTTWRRYRAVAEAEARLRLTPSGFPLARERRGKCCGNDSCIAARERRADLAEMTTRSRRTAFDGAVRAKGWRSA
jgi:hypothetical protein